MADHRRRCRTAPAARSEPRAPREQRRRDSITATQPLRKSSAKTASPTAGPARASALVAPMFPLPIVRRSMPARELASTSPNGTAPSRYETSERDPLGARGAREGRRDRHRVGEGLHPGRRGRPAGDRTGRCRSHRERGARPRGRLRLRRVPAPSFAAAPRAPAHDRPHDRGRHRRDVHRPRGARRRARSAREGALDAGRARARRGRRASTRCRAARPARAHVIHGTTVALNALLDRGAARTALVTNARLPRPDRDRAPGPTRALRAAPRKPEPLVPRELRFEVGERVWPDPDPRRRGLVSVARAGRGELRRARARAAARAGPSRSPCACCTPTPIRRARARSAAALERARRADHALARGSCASTASTSASRRRSSTPRSCRRCAGTSSGWRASSGARA